MGNNVVKVGLAGFGTVGAGVAKLLLENAESIRNKTGLSLELAVVVDKDTTTRRPITLPAGILTDDMSRLLDDKDIDIAVELIGGTTFAKELQLKMLAAGKHVVTANKALLAEHGPQLYAAARKAGRCIAFEASCAGGVPIISAIRTGLAANNIKAIYGIVNGTCNYILSNMTANDMEFDIALAQAQKKGYAEADPTLDINGADSAHKLTILGSLAFGMEISYDSIYCEGIEGVHIDDIRHGREMGYVMKLLAIGEREPDGRVSLRVHPSFIHEDTPLARVDGPFNGVCVFGDAVGETFYYGRGAGMMPTASAVVADIIETAMGNSQKIFDNLSLTPAEKSRAMIADVGQVNSRFYIRVMAKDRPGVFAVYGRILGDHQISISGVLQHEGIGPDNSVPVVITTHYTSQKNMLAALEELKHSEVVSGEPVCIRIVDIPEDLD